MVEATKKLITSVLPRGSVDADTMLVLTNAIYFKGQWEEPFRRTHTKEHRFYRLDGSVVRVPFMAGSKSNKYKVSCYDGFKVLDHAPVQAGQERRWRQRAVLHVHLPTDGTRRAA